MSRTRLIVFAVLLVSCTSAPPAVSPEQAGGPTTPTREPTTAPTTMSAPAPTSSPKATPTGAPTPSVAATPLANADGTIWVLHEPGVGWMFAGDDAVWISSKREENHWDIDRILPGSNVLDHVMNVPAKQQFVFGMGVNNSVWLLGTNTDAVTRYDMSGVERDVLPVDKGSLEPVLAFGDLWTLNHEGSSVSRVDTETATVEATLEIDPAGKPLWMTEGDGRLWFVAVNSSIYEIDPQANEIVRVIDTGYDRLLSLTYFAGKLWARSADTADIVTVDPSTEEVTTGPQPFRTLYPYVAENGWVWLPGASDGHYIDHLVALDPTTTEQVGSFDLVESMSLAEGGYATGFDSIWITGKNGALRIPEDVLPTD